MGRKRESRSFAELLSQLRAAKGLTVAELAEAVGLSRMGVHKLEHGSAPSWATVQALADALGVSTEALRDR